MKRGAIVLHGGAGSVEESSLPTDKKEKYLSSLRLVLEKGYEMLMKGDSALDVVVRSVEKLEDNELFNAGRGSVLNADGRVQMDASVMDGNTGMAGAVAAISRVKNPVLFARTIMEHSPHVLMIGQGAEEFAIAQGIPLEKDEYFLTADRLSQLERARNDKGIYLDHENDKKFGTVGAVAFDSDGNLAAATSTGGMTNKMAGRIGDTPLIGAGTFAKNVTCAVSCTGHGEFFIRNVVAYDISALMEYGNLSLKEALQRVVKKLSAQGGEGGIIAVDKHGEIEMAFNSKALFRGWKTETSEGVGIWDLNEND